MKNCIYLILCLLAFSSCTRTVYTHEEYMNSIKTKYDAINAFGAPTSKSVEGNLEVWNFHLGSGVIGTGFANGYAYNNNANVYGSTLYTNFTRQITIVFDGNDAIRWNTQGVNLKKEEPNKSGTVLAVIG